MGRETIEDRWKGKISSIETKTGGMARERIIFISMENKNQSYIVPINNHNQTQAEGLSTVC